jgi:hypothetical protein
MPFHEFLQTHTATLAKVHNRATLAGWHRAYADAWTHNARALADSANVALELQGDHSIKPDVGYLAVERRVQGPCNPPWVLLCANPGWQEASNEVERVLKGQRELNAPCHLETYEAFRTRFMDRWYPEVMQRSGRSRGAGWWNRASTFLHRISGLEKPPGMMTLHPEWDVIGWDLWPFHSTRDGLSHRVQDQQNGLQAFAKASLLAALRMEGTAGVIAASSAANRIVQTLAENGNHELRTTHTVEFRATYEQRDGQPRTVRVPVSRHEYGKDRRTLIVVGRQIFSNFGSIPRELNERLIAWIQNPVNEPVDGPAAAPAPRGHRRAAHNVAAEVAVKPVGFTAPAPGQPLVISVPVTENAFLDAPNDEDDEEMHTRTVGYWQRRADGPLANAVGQALGDQQRVFIMARAAGYVLRMYEVVPGADTQPPNNFVHKTEHEAQTFTRLREQPEELQTADGAPFATAYRYSGKTRLRFHGADCNDEALRRAPLVTDVPFGQFPVLCTFGNVEDPRVVALLNA